jgi:hypothetical protein
VAQFSSALGADLKIGEIRDTDPSNGLSTKHHDQIGPHGCDDEPFNTPATFEYHQVACDPGGTVDWDSYCTLDDGVPPPDCVPPYYAVDLAFNTYKAALFTNPPSNVRMTPIEPLPPHQD